MTANEYYTKSKTGDDVAYADKQEAEDDEGEEDGKRDNQDKDGEGWIRHWIERAGETRRRTKSRKTSKRWVEKWINRKGGEERKRAEVWSKPLRRAKRHATKRRHRRDSLWICDSRQTSEGRRPRSVDRSA